MPNTEEDSHVQISNTFKEDSSKIPSRDYYFKQIDKQKPIPILLYLSGTQILAVSGALSGFTAGVSVCPLDVAKTRLQAQGVLLKKKTKTCELKYRGIFQTLGKIFKEEGVHGLYRGLVPITVGYLPTWMIYFTVYEKAKIFYPKMVKGVLQIDDQELKRRTLLNYWIYSISAMTAGAASTAVTNPIWVVKTRLMLQTGNGNTIYNLEDLTQAKKNYYTGTFDAFRKMYKNEGIKVFYSGLVPSLFGLFHVAIHFPTYEFLKNMLNVNKDMKSIQENKRKILYENDSEAKKERFYFFCKLILASSLSKMVASSVTYPHEVLRTRLQIRSILDKSSGPKKNRLINTITDIYKNEGLIGFYSGYATNLTRTIPASAITLVSFEFIRLYFEKINVVDSI